MTGFPDINGEPHAWGIMDIQVDPHNSDVIYLATGNLTHLFDEATPGNNNYSYGVYMSTDKGVTWDECGNLSWDYKAIGVTSKIVTKIAIDKNSYDQTLGRSKTVYALTYSNSPWPHYSSLWKSIDGGQNWSWKKDFTDTDHNCTRSIDIDPDTSSILYIGGSLFYKSTDGGNSWELDGSRIGIPTSKTITRIETEIHPNDPFTIYAYVAFKSGTSELYKSTDKFYHFNSTPLASYGTREHHHEITISPNSPYNIFLGSLRVQHVVDGASVNNNIGSPHVDVREIRALSDHNGGCVLFNGHDGGFSINNITNTTVNGWETFNNGLNILEIYGIAIDKTNEIAYGGTQDNGIYRYNGTWTNVWTATDAYDCIVNQDQPGNVITLLNSWAREDPKWILATDDGYTNATGFASIPYTGVQYYNKPLLQKPSDPKIVISGAVEVYQKDMSTNFGSSWTAKSNFGLTGNHMIFQLVLWPFHQRMRILYISQEVTIYT